jgi:hypothetical protein
MGELEVNGARVVHGLAFLQDRALMLLSLDIVVICESSDRTNQPLRRDSTSFSQNM